MVWLCCIQEAENVKVLDFKHCGLTKIPGSIIGAERTLEMLHLDSNQIKALPRELFSCDNLRKLTASDNEITVLPAAVGALSRLEELDLSKNGILELPEDIKGCKSLLTFEASVNPLGRLPDGFTQLLNLTTVYLNDAFLEYLPGSFGRLSKLKILELRENHLKTLPKSLGRLTDLERLDIGNNEFAELPEVTGSLVSLLELWCDSNQIAKLPDSLGNLKQLMYLDASKNRISSVGDRIDGCACLSDLHLSMNLLHQLPQSIGRLSNLTTLKVDDNRLTSLPASMGGLVALSELDVTANDLEELPPTIGLLRHLRTLIADENFLIDIPSELGSCTALTVLSARSNKLTYLPDEIGRIQRLRVLNVSDNELKCLPSSLMNLRELQALWLAENQAKPLIRLQPEIDGLTGKRSLTCYLLPQQRMSESKAYTEDNTSFRASVWDEQRLLRQQIHFDSFSGDNEKLPSHYPKEKKVRGRHEQNMAILKTTSNGGIPSSETSATEVTIKSVDAPASSNRTVPHRLLRLEKEKIAKDKARINHRHGEEEGEQHNDTPRALETTRKAGDSTDWGFAQNRTSSVKSLPPAESQTESAFRIHDAVPRGSRGSVSSVAVTRDSPATRTNGSTVAAAEEHFGVFLSDENPELYHRRFQYYKRVRRSRREGEAASDLGYYGGAGADRSGSSRPPLMSGWDGSSSEWDARTDRSTGDGYASDLEGYNAGRRHHKHRFHPGHLMPPTEAEEELVTANNRRASDRRTPVLRLPAVCSALEPRPRAPPAYHNSANGSNAQGDYLPAKALQSSPFPPPPPYKPPTRDLNPDGASNEGDVTRSLVSLENSASKEMTAAATVNAAGGRAKPGSVPVALEDPASQESTGVWHRPSGRNHLANTPQANPYPAPPAAMPPLLNGGLPYAAGVGGSGPSERPDFASSTPCHELSRAGFLPDSSWPSPLRVAPDPRPLTAAAPQVSRSSGFCYTAPSFGHAANFYGNGDGGNVVFYTEHISQQQSRLSGYQGVDGRAPRHPRLVAGAGGAALGTTKSAPQWAADNAYGALLHTRGGEPALQTRYGHGVSADSAARSADATPPWGAAEPVSASRQLVLTPTAAPTPANRAAVSFGADRTAVKPQVYNGHSVSNVDILTFNLSLAKVSELGFSIAGGLGSQGNPFRLLDKGIFVSKVSALSPAANVLQPGDKILQVNGTDFSEKEHHEAVSLLKSVDQNVTITIERMQPTTV